MLKKFLAALLAVAMVINIIPTTTMTVQAAEGEYEIYPIPHSIAYKEGNSDIGNDVNVVYENNIDEATKNKLKNVLEDHGITYGETSEAVSGKTNVLVGIKDSENYVDHYADTNVSYDEATFAQNHYDAYVLDIQDGVITVLGDTTDGAFYGIVSLMHILNQAENGSIRNLTINDYADTAIRGFIEGYYGIPWSNEDRMSLMEFGGQFKMTSYIFAPKDDPYHTTKWRDEYPEAELNAIKEMVAVGNANKCRFVWTAHPFMGGFKSNDVAGEIDALLAKFEQLYKAGVRQFGVLGDDVGQLNRTIVVEVMNAVAAWADGKGDVYDTVFCPANYNHAYTNNNYGEINTYDTGFSENVQIFWTGEGVCKPIERATLDHFRRYQLTDGKTTRRAPLFWLNWPVNDINSARMLMGKGSLLHTDIDPADLAGVVTNPMQEAESSKVALFAIADYAWNVKGFNDDQSWKDSFQYIDGNAAAELYTLAKHMSDPSPNGHGLVLEESEELKPLLENYETKLEAGTLTEEELTGLMAEFQGIAEACDGFHEKSGNENLKDELKPFTDSLKEQALAAVEYLRAQQSIKDGNSNEVWNHYAQGNTYLADSKKHVKPILKKAEGKNITDEGIVAPSAKRITPFVENLGKTLSPLVSGLIDDSKLIRTYITSRADSPATGSLTEIFDGNIDSEAIYKTPNRIAKGEYVGVKYSKKIAIENIRIVLGSGVDHFDHGKLQYTEDGYAWKDLELTGMTNEFQGVRDQIQDVTVAKENLPENFRAMGIRFIATQANANAAWLRVREIMINGFEAAEEETEIYTNKESVTGFTSNLTNDSAVLSSSSPVSLTPGEFVGLQLERIKDISEITVEGTGVEALTLQTSKNAVVWNDVNLSARAGYEDARYIRLINKTDADVTATLTNLTVKSLEFQPISKFETNYITTTTGNNPAETVMNLFDKDRTTETILRNAQEIQTEGDYIIYDLGQCIDLESLKLVLYDGTTDFPRHAKISVSTDHQHWEEVMTIGNQDSANEGEAENADSITGLFPVHEVSYNTLEATNIGKQARYLKFEITRTKQGAKKMGSNARN